METTGHSTEDVLDSTTYESDSRADSPTSAHATNVEDSTTRLSRPLTVPQGAERSRSEAEVDHDQTNAHYQEPKADQRTARSEGWDKHHGTNGKADTQEKSIRLRTTSQASDNNAQDDLLEEFRKRFLRQSDEVVLQSRLVVENVKSVLRIIAQAQASKPGETPDTTAPIAHSDWHLVDVAELQGYLGDLEHSGEALEQSTSQLNHLIGRKPGNPSSIRSAPLSRHSSTSIQRPVIREVSHISQESSLYDLDEPGAIFYNPYNYNNASDLNPSDDPGQDGQHERLVQRLDSRGQSPTFYDEGSSLEQSQIIAEHVASANGAQFHDLNLEISTHALTEMMLQSRLFREVSDDPVRRLLVPGSIPTWLTFGNPWKAKPEFDSTSASFLYDNLRSFQMWVLHCFGLLQQEQITEEQLKSAIVASPRPQKPEFINEWLMIDLPLETSEDDSRRSPSLELFDVSENQKMSSHTTSRHSPFDPSWYTKGTAPSTDIEQYRHVDLDVKITEASGFEQSTGSPTISIEPESAIRKDPVLDAIEDMEVDAQSSSGHSERSIGWSSSTTLHDEDTLDGFDSEIPEAIGDKFFVLRGRAAGFAVIPCHDFRQRSLYMEDNLGLLQLPLTDFLNEAVEQQAKGDSGIAVQCMECLVVLRLCQKFAADLAKPGIKLKVRRAVERMEKEGSSWQRNFRTLYDSLKNAVDRLARDAYKRHREEIEAKDSTDSVSTDPIETDLPQLHDRNGLHSTRQETFSAGSEDNSALPTTNGELEQGRTRQNRQSDNSTQYRAIDQNGIDDLDTRRKIELESLNGISNASVHPIQSRDMRQLDDRLLQREPMYKQLSSKYRTPATGKFFSLGTVFAILWHESRGERLGGRMPEGEKVDEMDTLSPNTTTGPFGELIYTHIRRLVVIRNRAGYCWCLAINSYGGQGLAKSGLKLTEKNAHAIIYDEQKEPESLPGEPDIMKRPIPVVMAPGETLSPSSRLHYGKPYSVEWNTKVMTIGKVKRRYLPILLAEAREEICKADGESEL